MLSWENVFFLLMEERKCMDAFCRIPLMAMIPAINRRSGALKRKESYWGFLPLESFGSYICCGFVMFDMVYFCFVNIHNDIKEDS